MVPVLPVLVPKPVGVGTGEEQAGSDSASDLLASSLSMPSPDVAIQDHPDPRSRSSVRKFTQRRDGNVQEGDLFPQVFKRLAIPSMTLIGLRCIIPLTRGAGGVLLDVLALLDEGVLGGGAGKTTLGGSAHLRSEARGGTGELSDGRHRGRRCSLTG